MSSLRWNQNGRTGRGNEISLKEWEDVLEGVSVDVCLHDGLQLVATSLALHRARLRAQTHHHSQVVLETLPPLLHHLHTLEGGGGGGGGS